MALTAWLKILALMLARTFDYVITRIKLETRAREILVYLLTYSEQLHTQLGYVVLACGLSNYSIAVFHLVKQIMLLLKLFYSWYL